MSRDGEVTPDTARSPDRAAETAPATPGAATPPVSHPLGIALSGGGFRATAFHLGVLKRLCEIRLLHESDFLSTVSGGSIVGAAWVYWQRCRGDTLTAVDEWNRFETTLIDLMRGGLRGRIFWRGLVFSLLMWALFALVVGVVAPWSSISIALVALVPSVAAWYVWWHYRATHVLERLYDRLLFRDARMEDVAPNKLFRTQLIVNATGLHKGEHLVLAAKPQGFVPGVVTGLSIVLSVLTRQRAAVELDSKITVARAVTASSAFPLMFAPLLLGGPWAPIHGWLNRHLPVLTTGARSPDYLATDGGIFDNQGTQALLERACHAVIISDAAAALAAVPKPSTWTVSLFRGQGLLLRCQDIVYERSRDLGYQLLAAREKITKLFAELAKFLPKGRINQLRVQMRPSVEGYAYVELLPSRLFKYAPTRPFLAPSLTNAVARIRTDLDRFSDVEISALMFHGYSLIDHCLLSYHPGWPLNISPSAFQTADARINIPWAGLDSTTLQRYADHLAVSGSRMFIWRVIRRAVLRCWAYLGAPRWSSRPGA